MVPSAGGDGQRRARTRAEAVKRHGFAGRGRISSVIRIVAAATTLLAGGFAVAAFAAAEDVTGTWLTANGLSHVRVAPCGASRCGTIVWTKALARDTHNPDPSQRDRNLVGLRIFANGQAAENGWTGTLYNPLDGRTYSGKMRVKGAGELELSGCVLAGLICQSQTWTRIR